jgi:hypothetical protein
MSNIEKQWSEWAEATLPCEYAEGLCTVIANIETAVYPKKSSTTIAITHGLPILIIPNLEGLTAIEVRQHLSEFFLALWSKSATHLWFIGSHCCEH